MRYFEDHPDLAESLLESLPSGIALIDDLGAVADLNHRLAEMTGYRLDDLVGQDIHLLVPLIQQGKNFNLRPELDGHPSAKKIVRHRNLTVLCHDGNELSVDFACSRLEMEGRSWVVAAFRDNTVQRAAEDARIEAEGHTVAIEAAAAEALAQSEQRFRLAFEGNMAPMVFSDRNGMFLAVNDAFCRMSGRSREELIGNDSKQFTYPEDIGITEDVYRRINSGETDQVRYGKRFLHKNGRIVIAEVSISPARDETGRATYYVSSVRDITEERALAAQLSFQALHDPLTGLANRALFDDRLAQAHTRVLRYGGTGAVLLIDLDDFKGVNDVYGHLVGDELLVSIAHRFEQVTRSSDTLCRFGGDEFLYLAEGLTSPAEAEQIAKRLLDALTEPFSFNEVHIEQRASTGIVIWDGSNANIAELVQNADAAMYEAKRQGHGHHVVFTSDMRHEAVSRFALVQDLRQAIASGQLLMHYQPIIDLATTDVVGFEALMRWSHPERGWVPPDVFIPLAEKSDLILELGAFAIREAVTAASSWKPRGAQAISPYVTVNLSARQFHDPGLVPMIEKELTRSGLEPERLILEVTEGVALIDITETMNVMEHLNRLRVGVALDDFGTGYSSLSYLAALNPRIIKIDQSFVRPKHDKKRSDTLLEAIVTLGNKLDMVVLAEGIETSAQLERLHNLDCELGQGFLWSPAVPVEEVTSMLGERSQG
ncbi:MAG: putative bifunctional diguanylate cyclase/phosphodiesterase [Acidimicrobiales bacterium]